MKKEVILLINNKEYSIAYPWEKSKGRIKITKNRNCVVKANNSVAILKNSLKGTISGSKIYASKHNNELLVVNITPYIQNKENKGYLEGDDKNYYWVFAIGEKGTPLLGLDFVTSDIQEIDELFLEFFYKENAEKNIEEEEDKGENEKENKNKKKKNKSSKRGKGQEKIDFTIKIDSETLKDLGGYEGDEKLEIISGDYLENELTIKNYKKFIVEERKFPIKTIIYTILLLGAGYASGEHFLSKDDEYIKNVKKVVCDIPGFAFKYNQEQEFNKIQTQSTVLGGICNNFEHDGELIKTINKKKNANKGGKKIGLTAQEYELLGQEEVKKELLNINDSKNYTNEIERFNKIFKDNVMGWQVYNIAVKGDKVSVFLKRLPGAIKLKKLYRKIGEYNYRNNLKFIKKKVAPDFNSLGITYRIKASKINNLDKDIKKILNSEQRGVEELIKDLNKTFENVSPTIKEGIEIDKIKENIENYVINLYNNLKNGKADRISSFSKDIKAKKIQEINKILKILGKKEDFILNERLNLVTKAQKLNIFTKNSLINGEVKGLSAKASRFLRDMGDLRLVVKEINKIKSQVKADKVFSGLTIEKNEFAIKNPEEEINSLLEDFYIYKWEGFPSKPQRTYPYEKVQTDASVLYKPFAYKYTMMVSSNEDTIGLIPLKSIYKEIVNKKWLYVDKIDYKPQTGEWKIKLYYYK